jgi:hypothetical protein
VKNIRSSLALFFQIMRHWRFQQVKAVLACARNTPRMQWASRFSSRSVTRAHADSSVLMWCFTAHSSFFCVLCECHSRNVVWFFHARKNIRLCFKLLKYSTCARHNSGKYRQRAGDNKIHDYYKDNVEDKP